MEDFLIFFNDKVNDYPMRMEISFSKNKEWSIHIWKEEETNVEIAYVKDCDMQYTFAKAQIALKEWLYINEGGY